MLYFDRTNASEGIDVNKASESKEFDIFHYLQLLPNLQPNACNRCHDLLIMYV